MAKRKAVQTVLPGVSTSPDAITIPNMVTFQKRIGKRYVMIYSDPMTQKLLEGKAQVIEVTNMIPLDRGYVMLYCTVHFKGDPKWQRNERKIMMRG